MKSLEDTVSEYGKAFQNMKLEECKKYDFRPDNSVSVFDVAAYIVEKIKPITTIKLQKLVYYCQAWSLVWDEKAIFSEDIEAWVYGPVVRKLFYYHQGSYVINSIMMGNSRVLNEEQQETIDAVLSHYGDKPSQWLVDLTHMEKPWKMARKGMSDTERGNRPISLDSMANYYSSISED